MADSQQIKIIKEGISNWNIWREKNPRTQVDFSSSDFSGIDLSNANLFRANFYKANLTKTVLNNANLTGANFYKTRLVDADLTNSNLEHAGLVEVQMEGAILTGCRIYGLSVWDIIGKPKDQSNLIITNGATEITVDDLQVAQFIYLLLNRENLRNVIQTLSSKAVLILGRFTPERKVILDTLAESVRTFNLLPIIFDFEKSTSRDFTETIKILAGLSLFVIADITSPKSSPLELQATVPDYQIPFVPIIQKDEEPFSMFHDLKKYDWVLQPISYKSSDSIKAAFHELIFERAVQKHKEIQLKKAKTFDTLSADEYLKQTMNS